MITKKITYKKQGDNNDSWIIEDFDNDELIDKIVVYERPYQWVSLRLGLMGSKAFKRIVDDPSLSNHVAYGALQTILSTEGDEQHLLFMLNKVMTFTEEEKDEINQIFEDSFFTIKL